MSVHAVRVPAQFLLALALAAAACSDDTGETASGGGGAGSTATAQGGSGQGGSGQGASGQGGSGPAVTTGAGGEGGGDSNAIEIPLEEFCAGEGKIPVPGGSEDAPCLEDLAKKTFKFALCSCTDISVTNGLTTSAIDSESGDGLLAGSVGANRDFDNLNSVDIGGSLWVGGTISSGNNAVVAQNLRAGGEASFLRFEGGRNAYAASDVSATVSGTLAEDLHIAEGATHDLDVGGDVIVEPVGIPEPCDCDSPVPFGAIVDAFEAKNDNEELGIAFSYDDTSVDLELPCGRFFFTGLHAGNTVSIHLTGRTVIAVAGDITATNGIHFTLDEGASLDLFVDGQIVAGNSFVAGLESSPVATRIYASGDGISLGNSIILNGNIYMPNSPLDVGNGALVNGAVFAQDVDVSNSAFITYDAAILGLDGCKLPPGGCDDCGDCENPTPSCGDDGTCGACATDDDCCGPTVCLADGTCGYVGPN
jgi:hypothetical protein